MLSGEQLVGATRSVITEFVVIALYLVQPIAFVINIIQPLLKGRESSRKIADMKLIQNSADKVDTTRIMINQDWKVINFDHVSYQYQCASDYSF